MSPLASPSSAEPPAAKDAGRGDSAGLWREYVSTRSEAAFGGLVTRHLGLVYGTALRRCGGDTGLAQDVAQTVFVDLARKAAELPEGVVLAGWLHRHTTFVAATAVRTEVRRRQREATAMELHDLDGAGTADWARVAPVLEDALHELSDRDREAIVLRFLDGQAFARVGASLGVSEDAARMRVDRAVDKLRALLARRGVTSTAAALAVALGQHAAVAVPVGLAANICAAAAAATAVSMAGGIAVAGGTVVGTATAAAGTTAASFSTSGILGLMSTTKLAWGMAGLLAVGSAGLIVKSNLADRRSRAEIEALRAEVATAQAAADEARAALARDAARLDEARREREQLMSLRGEVGPLREAAREKERLATENRRLADAVAAGAKPGTKPAAKADEDEDDGETQTARAMAIARMNFGKSWVLAFLLYAGAHEDRLPASFADAAEFFPERNRSVDVLDPNRFEIVYRGRLSDIKDPSRTILVREKVPFEWPMRGVQAEGKPLAKMYAFADGHSEIHAAAEGDFEAWERERMQPAPGK